MRRQSFLTLVTVLGTACSGSSTTGPADGGRDLGRFDLQTVGQDVRYTGDEPTIVHCASSASSSKGPPVPARQRSNAADTVALLLVGSAIVAGSVFVMLAHPLMSINPITALCRWRTEILFIEEPLA